MAHLFICPNCGRRTSATERTAGFRNMPKGCSNCGFGFLFELLDDYYPAPNAAFFICDQQGRIIACGRGSQELTGLSDEKVIGRPVQRRARARVRGRRGPRRHRAGVGRAPAGQARRRHAEGDLPAKAVADLFPAYDDDGGLLLILTPVEVGLSFAHAMSERRRNLFILLVVLGLIVASVVVVVDQARPSSASTSRAASRSSTRASRPSSSRRSTPRALDRAVDIIRDRVDALGVAEPRAARSGREPDRGRPPGVERRRARRAPGRHHGPDVLLRLGDRTSSTRTARPTRTQVNGGQTAISGLYNAVKRASKCEPAGRRQQHDRRPTAATRFDKRPSSRSTTACRRRTARTLVDELAGRTASSDQARDPQGARGHHRRARRDRRDPDKQRAEARRLVGHEGQPGALAARTSRTRSRTSTSSPAARPS